MNIVDFILGVLCLVSFIAGIIFLALGVKDDEVGAGICVMGMCWFIVLILGFPFMVLDRGSGSTVGEITSVDKNFFGTTAVYIKTSETAQEEYCIEDETVAEQAKELIGKKVKVSYGERVGIYSTGRCSQAPIEKIEVINEGSGE